MPVCFHGGMKQTPIDEASQRLGEKIREACESGRTGTIEQIVERAGIDEPTLQSLIAGSRPNVWDFPQRMQTQDALGWAPGSWEAALRGENPRLLRIPADGPYAWDSLFNKDATAAGRSE